MNLPQPGDYIDIHTHGGKLDSGVFFIENLMAHEERTPEDLPEQVCTFGIHPWFLNDKNSDQLLNRVHVVSGFSNLVAIGEAGIDKLRGPDMALQRKSFEEQIVISEEIKKPIIIHCVRAWEELFTVHKRVHPKMPWLVHGFRGKEDLAKQLLFKGMYLSLWFDFVIHPGSTKLLKSLPKDRIFLETDGSDFDIRLIYGKVASDMDISIEELKSVILRNFNKFFKYD